MPEWKRRQKSLRVSNLALFFKWYNGNDAVNQYFEPCFNRSVINEWIFICVAYESFHHTKTCMVPAPDTHGACVHAGCLVSQAKTTKDIHTGQQSTQQPPTPTPTPPHPRKYTCDVFQAFFSLTVTSHQTRQTERWHCWQQTISPSSQRLWRLRCRNYHRRQRFLIQQRQAVQRGIQLALVQSR